MTLHHFLQEATMRSFIYCVLFLLLPVVSNAVDCSLVYDEYDSLMNKNFLLEPSKYVPTIKTRLSRNDYNSIQKGKFLLREDRRGLGVAIVHTNSNNWAKLLFTWGRPVQNSQPTLIVKETTLYQRVTDGNKPVTRRNLNVRSSFRLDLDTGETGGTNADIWYHNVDGKTMYIEAVNGAKIEFPLQSLCQNNAAENLHAIAINPAVLSAVSSDAILTEIESVPANNSNSSSTNSESSDTGRTVIKRELLANGHVLTSYSDGSKIENYSGGMTIIQPDGSRSSSYFKTNAPVAIPVDAPGEMENAWLELHRQNLLGIIQSIVNDQELVDQAILSIDSSGNPYESIQTRSNIIQQLVSP